MTRYVTILAVILGIAVHPAIGQERQVLKKYSTVRFVEILKPFQSNEFAVGIQAKGKLANVITNYGQLANFHNFSPALEWPAFGEGQDDEQQYGWGVDFMIGINGDVVESFQDPSSNLIDRDWMPLSDGLYSGLVTVSETDQTPIMATSDNPETWPLNDSGQPFWPGLFRTNTEGTVFEGEFVSERDLYCAFTDEANDIPYGLWVEQTAYAFSRRYAEDFLVFRFNIKNTSTETIENAYPGMMVQFLPDFDNHDLINFTDSNGDGKRDLVYLWDTDQSPQEPWSKVGYVGLVAVRTPDDAGITNFHFFADDFTPSKDETFWDLLTSDTTGLSDTTRAKYFHGSDFRFDDVSLAPALDPEGNNEGAEISWTFSVGPVTLAPGDSTQLEIALVCGNDETDLLENVGWVWFLAANAWNGSNPPSPPAVSGYGGPGKATVVWDAVTSENGTDNITGLKDFEGYKIYRSQDQGKTWGDIITDSRGNFEGFQPLAQFDKINGITGNDPYSGRYLGGDTGLRHTFVDTTVLNGVEYWYTVTAYDRGDSVNQVESLESALGLTVDEPNVVSVTPMNPPANANLGTVSVETGLQPVAGTSNGTVLIEIMDPLLLQDRTYEITFRENTPIFQADTLFDSATTFSLFDADAGSALLTDHPLTDDSGDNLPVVDGFRLTVTDVEPGRSFAGWTKVAADTSNFDWYFDTHNLANYFEATVEGIADFKLVVTYDDSTLIRVVTVGDSAIDGLGGVRLVDQIYVPIKIFDVTDPEQPVDVSEKTLLFDFEYWGLFPPGTFGPKGWDLVPGGKGYNSRTGPFAYPDELFFISTPEVNPLLPDTSIVSVRTQNFDSMLVEIQGVPTQVAGIAPSDGDEYTIQTRKPFNNQVVYEFSTAATTFSEARKQDLKKIRVVPNPFLVTSGLEDRIMFTNLPDECTLWIFTVAGDLVQKIKHSDGSGTAYWDLKNKSGLDVAYGLYVYVVKTPGGQKDTGKFSIIR